MQKKIYEILNEIGVPCGLSGRDFLALAIEIAHKKGRISITKELYPAIGEAFNVSKASAERCMRHAIEKTFDTGNVDGIRKFFGNTVSLKTGKLANSDFIYGLVEYLKIYG